MLVVYKDFYKPKKDLSEFNWWGIHIPPWFFQSSWQNYNELTEISKYEWRSKPTSETNRHLWFFCYQDHSSLSYCFAALSGSHLFWKFLLFSLKFIYYTEHTYFKADGFLLQVFLIFIVLCFCLLKNWCNVK